MIEIRYLDKNGKPDKNGKYYVYQDVKSMEQAEMLAKEMQSKGFLNVMIVDDGKDSWETYKKWLKRSLDFTKLASADTNASKEEKMMLQEKIKTFTLCLNKMEEMQKTW